MDDKELYERGLKLRVDMFGRDAVEKRMNAFGDFGKPLQHIINAYAYGDVWQRSALPPAVKSLAMVAIDGGHRAPERTARASEGCREKWMHGRADSGGPAVIGTVLRNPRSERSTSHRCRGAARVELTPRVAAR
jgi:hypothetical protein